MPKDMKGIVIEVKDKGNDNTFLTINYMKLPLILWKALQESITKIEHLEATVFELQEEIKDMKKPKAKAESKSEK